MKSKIFRILAMVVILSLLMIVIPATPALAQSIALSVTSGPTGTVIIVTGAGFTPGTGYVWFDTNDDNALDAGEPQVQVTVTGAGVLPAGIVILTVPTVVRGTYDVVADIPAGLPIEASLPFTLKPQVTLSDPSGNVGDTITVDGSGFAASKTITIYYDNTPVGTDATNSNGVFTDFTFTIPESEQGAHTVKAKDTVGYSPAVTFVVSPEITIDPTSGVVGDEIIINGTGFAAHSDMSIYFDADEVNITGGYDFTNANGSFSGVIITVPDTFYGSHNIRAEDKDNNSDTVTFTVARRITIDPTSGPAGVTVTVTGTGFKASYIITIRYDGDLVVTSPVTVTTNPTGYFSATFTVPAVLAGTYEVKVTDGTDVAVADFVSTTDASISQTTTIAEPGHVGMGLTITGTGFAPDDEVTITYESGSIDLGAFETDENGAFEAEITIPASQAGAHTITVTDGFVTKVFDFVMESSTPAVPELLLPFIGENTVSEAVFDWGDVTDLSLPVTYELQVATDASFTSASILVDKEGLTDSYYTLTEEEALVSTDEDEPYYWRVRAVDAASNASGWTGIASFYVGLPFEFAGWVVYILIVVIAAIFLFLGLWLGKRGVLASLWTKISKYRFRRG